MLQIIRRETKIKKGYSNFTIKSVADENLDSKVFNNLRTMITLDIDFLTVFFLLHQLCEFSNLTCNYGLDEKIWNNRNTI